MTSSIGFYVKPKVFESNSFEDEELFGDEDFDTQGYLYEVPYTSSSVDRSSIGSIPWADDAIKINKTEWEKVEKMLSGVEPLSIAEDELKKEILDWQKKFPQILKHKYQKLKSATLDIESLPSLDMPSEDENYEIDDKETISRGRIREVKFESKSSEGDNSNICELMKNFTLKSVPFKINQLETDRVSINNRKCSSSTSSYSLRSPPTPVQVPSISTSTSRFRMPPILNVLESRRKFRNLAQNKNHSFVQLTQIQQTKSAAVALEPKSRSHFHTSYRSAWHVPFAANRFSNNRNTIILPSIGTKQQVNQLRYRTQPTTTSSTSELGTTNITPSSGEPRAHLLRNNNKSLLHNLANKQHLVSGSTTNASMQTNTSNTTSSGRSISAAVKYPRVTTFNALYLPYSASKFQAFK